MKECTASTRSRSPHIVNWLAHWNGYFDLSNFEMGRLGLGLDAEVGIGGSGGAGNSASADRLSFNGPSSFGTTTHSDLLATALTG